MTSEIFDTLRKWFLNYAESFNTDKTQFATYLLPKVEHSKQVSLLCRKLAEELYWQEDKKIIAEITGLLHDVGRFSQFAEFGTFVDSDSVNHGTRGYEVIRNSTVLSSISSNIRQKILEGIKFHNYRKFQQKVQPESIELLNLIRDADKLEKFMSLNSLLSKQVIENSVPVYTIQSDGPVNSKALAQIQRQMKVSKKNIKSQLDFHLMQLSWVFDIHYSLSFKHIFNMKVIDKLIGILPEDRDIRAVTQSVLNYLTAHLP
ncbi:MAG: HD domain-containing protein [Candidatus Latescibacteria bacterium]|nr:HD domain-containing protein [Candidatus Latescibacterota bacterium]